ncbi:MAG: substrate-binding domain-containing protein, partial [Dictyoglomus sp.]
MRRKIGVIVDNLYEYQWNILSGIFDSAEKFNLDIFCFTGKTLNTPSLNERQANLIYNLPKKENVNGLIILTSAIGSNTSSENLINFCKKYSKEIPTVSIGTVIEEIPSITIDNVSGFKEVLIHLIEDHALKDFAFISGPLQNLEAQIRFNTFLEIMKKYKLEINEEKIYYGDFLLNSGKEAIKTFLDKRKIKFEVLVCANDYMAIGATEELKRRGYLIPEDIKITGFDDIPEVNFLTPPLTTVYQPLYEMGWKSVEILTEMIEGKKVTDNVILPTKLVIRDSCGCRYSGIERAKLELTQENLLIELEKLKLLKDNFLNYVINNLNMAGIFREELEKLYFSLIDSLIQKDYTIFLKTLETLLKISELQKKNT